MRSHWLLWAEEVGWPYFTEKLFLFFWSTTNIVVTFMDCGEYHHLSNVTKSFKKAQLHSDSSATKKVHFRCSKFHCTIRQSDSRSKSQKNLTKIIFISALLGEKVSICWQVIWYLNQSRCRQTWDGAKPFYCKLSLRYVHKPHNRCSPAILLKKRSLQGRKKTAGYDLHKKCFNSHDWIWLMFFLKEICKGPKVWAIFSEWNFYDSKWVGDFW